MYQKISFFDDFPIYFLGPDRSFGKLPAFFYFALAADESLTLAPYNQPASLMQSEQIRVFSFTIPGHEEGLEKHRAMRYWAEALYNGDEILEAFFNSAIQAINYLIQEGWVDEGSIHVGGLSRGGFIATHLAARHPKIQTVLGFAPLTSLALIEEFIPYRKDSLFENKLLQLDLKKITSQLLHLHHLRFYIGNRDIRVNTDECYHFVRALTEKLYEMHIRKSHIELIITQSIGHKGHGTNSYTFEEGVNWLKHKIQGLSCKN